MPGWNPVIRENTTAASTSSRLAGANRSRAFESGMVRRRNSSSSSQPTATSRMKASRIEPRMRKLPPGILPEPWIDERRDHARDDDPGDRQRPAVQPLERRRQFALLRAHARPPGREPVGAVLGGRVEQVRRERDQQHEHDRQADRPQDVGGPSGVGDRRQRAERSRIVGAELAGRGQWCGCEAQLPSSTHGSPPDTVPVIVPVKLISTSPAASPRHGSLAVPRPFRVT